MEAEVKAYLESIQHSIEEVKRDMREGFKDIRTADYVKKADCEIIREPCEKKFEIANKSIEEIKKMLWKGMGAIAVLMLLAQVILKSIRVSF